MHRVAKSGQRNTAAIHTGDMDDPDSETQPRVSKNVKEAKISCGKMCVCGSTTHQRTTHRDCPRNKKRQLTLPAMQQEENLVSGDEAQHDPALQREENLAPGDSGDDAQYDPAVQREEDLVSDDSADEAHEDLCYDMDALYGGDLADRESILYTMNSSTSVRHDCESWPVLLGLPGTTEYMELQVHLPVDRKMWTIEIMHCVPSNVALLCTLCAAMHYLCTKPIQTRFQPSSIPFRQVDSYRVLKAGRVYHNVSTGFVYKIFEKENATTDPNIFLLKTVGLKEVQEETLTTDRKYFQVK